MGESSGDLPETLCGAQILLKPRPPPLPKGLAGSLAFFQPPAPRRPPPTPPGTFTTGRCHLQPPWMGQAAGGKQGPAPARSQRRGWKSESLSLPGGAASLDCCGSCSCLSQCFAKPAALPCLSLCWWKKKSQEQSGSPLSWSSTQRVSSWSRRLVPAPFRGVPHPFFPVSPSGPHSLCTPLPRPGS